ncbi:flavodoxin domain-containing protein [Aliiglaciecola sp. CAU 1673]|uniref:flavodoxin domain-containing protein n=1 Tax=Aliiglaciecola sp. CAU 1673 TaxID=3032595 RepID=UPI0023DAD297|nr:flavodoxin domain-containing protein [Aliiglaciecola sp. CAU 1673]MDF2179629.1 flavodoxin domain-containing protein [Aliiglaciecola sp. CAU 1673]
MAQISIFFGSVYGNAEQLAEQVASKLKEKGHDAQVIAEPQMDDFQMAEELLFISSTTGQGDIPPNLEGFILDLQSRFPLLHGKEFAVVGLGDSSYGDTYCGAGRSIFALLEELQGTAKAPLLQVDACETLEPAEEVLPWIDEIYG